MGEGKAACRALGARARVDDARIALFVIGAEPPNQHCATRHLRGGGHTGRLSAPPGEDRALIERFLEMMRAEAGAAANTIAAYATDLRLAPGMTADDLLEIVVEHPDARAILCCSHQPGLTYALDALTGCGEIRFGRPQVAVVSLGAPRRGGGTLSAVLPPDVLRKACLT